MDKLFTGIFIGIGAVVALAFISVFVSLLAGLMLWLVWDNFVAGNYYSESGNIVWVFPILGYWKSVAIWFVCTLLFKSTNLQTAAKTT